MYRKLDFSIGKTSNLGKQKINEKKVNKYRFHLTAKISTKIQATRNN
jgi:hypothetical protein